MTFAHTDASYARGFSRTYNNQASGGDCRDNTALFGLECETIKKVERNKKNIRKLRKPSAGNSV